MPAGRDRVLDTAYELFSRHGTRGVGVDRIRQQRRLLASACYATEVDVDRHPRWTNLVLLSIRTAD